MMYEDIKNLIKNHDLTTVILSSLWQTYVKTERILQLCLSVGLNVEGVTKDTPTFGELYSIQSAAIEGIIALSDCDINDETTFERISDMLAALYELYETHEIFDRNMIEYCEKVHHIKFK